MIMQKSFDEYLLWYNTIKVHQCLNWQMPRDFSELFFDKGSTSKKYNVL